MYDKILDDHVVDKQEDGTRLVYIDRHMVHEVTSPQAFEVFARLAVVRRPDCTLVTVDHNVPTSDRSAFDTVENFIKETDSAYKCWHWNKMSGNSASRTLVLMINDRVSFTS